MAQKKNKNNFYVYLHKRKDDNSVFYIGKGRYSRAYQTAYRNKEWQSIVSSVGFYNEFAQKNLSEEDAFKLEKDLIQQYGIENLANIMLGGDGGVSRDNPISELEQSINEVELWLSILENFDTHMKSKWFKHHMTILLNLTKLENEVKLKYGTEDNNN